MRKMSRIAFVWILIISLPLLLSACSTMGEDGLIRGFVQHNLGQTVDNRDVQVTVGGTVLTPDKRGYFYYRVEPGEYPVTAAYADVDRGISLGFLGQAVLTDKIHVLDLTIPLRDNKTLNGWALYRQNDFSSALSEFQSLMNGPSANDALNGLGWVSWVNGWDYDAAFNYFHLAVKEVRNIEARAGLAGIELVRVNVEGDAAFQRAYQNICLALREQNGISTSPRHDALGEGDLLALKALMSFMSGDESETEYILENYSDDLQSSINKHGEDILIVLDKFSG